MKIQQANQTKMNGKIFISDLFSGAKSFGMVSKHLSKRFVDYLESLSKGTPQWVKSYLEGVFDCRKDDLYENHLEFCYWVNGKRYSIHKSSDIYYRKHGIETLELNNQPNGHYWIKTGKLFFSDTILN